MIFQIFESSSQTLMFRLHDIMHEIVNDALMRAVRRVFVQTKASIRLFLKPLKS